MLQQAPFGKGSETVHDEAVRKTLQISSKLVHFQNPRFEVELQALAAHAAVMLGFGDSEDGDKGKSGHARTNTTFSAPMVRAELHKLLIYQPGDFFLDHRDAVHREGMFGTLLLQLPCAYQGGALTVEHGRKSVVIDHSDPQKSLFSVHFSAFYADCKHRVDKVTEGLRLILAFDLVSVGLPPASYSLQSSRSAASAADDGDDGGDAATAATASTAAATAAAAAAAATAAEDVAAASARHFSFSEILANAISERHKQAVPFPRLTRTSPRPLSECRVLPFRVTHDVCKPFNCIDGSRMKDDSPILVHALEYLYPKNLVLSQHRTSVISELKVRSPNNNFYFKQK